MVKIEAVIRPHLLDTVLEGLLGVGAGGLTLSEVRGSGHEKHWEHYRGAAYEVDLHPKLKLEMVVRDHLVEPVVRALGRGAHTGRIGDGIIFLMPVDDVVRIRTGVRGEFALM